MEPTLQERRKNLTGLQAERARLVAAVETARVTFEEEAATGSNWATPAGVLAHSDKEILAQNLKLRTAQRELGAAEEALRKFDSGTGNQLESRLLNLARLERAEGLASATADFKKGLRSMRELYLRGIELEQQLERQAKAAGYTRGPVSLFNSPAAYAMLRDLAAIAPELLPADDPNRRYCERVAENLQIHKEHSANGYRPKGWVPPPDQMTVERDSPASRVRRALAVPAE